MPAVTEYRLENGLKLLVVPDLSRGTFTLVSAFRSGWVDDPIGAKGAGHMLEHVSAMRTLHHPQLPQDTAEHGDLCSDTAIQLEHVTFCEVLPYSKATLRWALEVQADRVMHPLYTREGIELELAAMRQEEQLVRNDSLEYLTRLAFGAAFSSHIYGQNAVLEELQNITPEVLLRYHEQVYRPDNALLVLAGPIEPEDAKRFVEDAYREVRNPAAPKYQRSTRPQPPQEGERRIEVQQPGNVNGTLLAFRAPGAVSPDHATLTVLAQLLDGELMHPLKHSKALKGLNATVSIYVSTLSQETLFGIYGQVPSRVPLERIEKGLSTAVEQLKTLVTERAVDVAKDELQRAQAREFNDSRRLAFSLAQWEGNGGWRGRFQEEEKIRAVTVTDVRRVVERYFKRSNRTAVVLAAVANPTTVRVDPVTSVEPTTSVPHFEPGVPFDWSVDSLQQRTQRGALAGGLKYALVPVRERAGHALVSLNIHTSTLGKLNPTELALAAQWLARGPRGWTPSELKTRLNALGASLEVEATADGFRIVAEVDGDRVGQLLELIARMLREPALVPEAFAEVRSALLDRLTVSSESIRERVANACMARVFPRTFDGRAWVQSFAEQEASAKRATSVSTRAALNHLMQTASAELVVIGTQDPAQTQQQLDTLLSEVKFRPADAPALTDSVGRGVEKLKVLGATVSALCGAIRLDTPETATRLPALQLGALLLATAESAVSSLGLRLRFKEQLSYIALGWWNDFPVFPASTFHFIATYDPSKREEVTKAVSEEFARAGAGAFTQEQIRVGKALWQSRRLTHLATPTRLARILVSQIIRGTDFNEEAELAERVAKLTPAELSQGMKAALGIDSFEVVTAGP